MNEGFVKLNRRLLKWEWHDDPNMIALWVYILLRANWEDTQWHGVDIPRGSFISTLRGISKETGIPIQTVRTCLERLENTKEITKKSTHRNTHIFVVNWDKFQCIDGTPNTELTQNQHSTNTPLTLDKNNKNKKNKKKYIYSNLTEPIYDDSLNPDVDMSDLDEFLEEVNKA